MLLLPTSLLALTFLCVAAIPIDPKTCAPSKVSKVLGESYSTSTTVGAYCNTVLLADTHTGYVLPSSIQAPATAALYPPAEIRHACECVLAEFLALQPEPPLPPTSMFQQEDILALELGGPSAVRKGRPGNKWEPYGRGAVPAPLGSELKGFGARDNLYIRGGVVDGARNRVS